MSHYAYQKTGNSLDLDVDVVVVGSGAGGSVVAYDLALGGLKVALVEAGPWRDPKDYPESMYGTMRDMMDAWGALFARGRSILPIVQARLVGGTTVINSAIVVRTPGDIFKEWRDEHGFGGDALAERIWTYQDQIEDELKVGEVPAGSYGRSNALAEKGARALNLHDHAMHRNVWDCQGTGNCLQGCKKEKKQSANLVYVPTIMEKGGAVISCAPVRKVIIKDGRAVGVTGRFVHPQTGAKGDTFRILGKKAIVVAASATQSPALLQRSGIRLKAMGEFFRAHPGTNVFGIYDERVDMNKGATQGWSSTSLRESEGLKLETLSLPLELIAGRLSGAGHTLMERLQEFPYIAMWVQAIRADTVGSVRTNIFGEPVVRYSLIPRDIQRMRIGAHALAKMQVEAGAKTILPGIQGMPYRISPDEVDTILDAPMDPRNWFSALTHLFGGCVMGSDPDRTVCNPNGEVRGVSGLIVSDASQIPTTLGVNPQHTIMALSRLRAHQIMDGEIGQVAPAM